MLLSDINIGHVVEDYMQGNVMVRICDDYCKDKTKNEIRATLRRIEQLAWRCFLRELV